MVKLEYFTIGTSSHVSGLCHSIIRGEVFTTCLLGCAYCYARWYRGPHGSPRPIFDILRLIKALGKLVEKNIPATPVRFSALSDPFQPPAKITLKALKLAYKLKVPVIVNTKLYPSEKHFKVLEDLASEGLLVLQVSITAEKGAKEVRILEPLASPIEERIKLVEKASNAGIPTVVRIQPLIPGLSDRNVENFLDEIAWAGARMVVIEFLRIEKEAFEFYKKLFSSYSEVYSKEWESYLPRTSNEEAPLIQVPLEYKLKTAELFARESKRRSLAFATCKEGLFNFHEPKTIDCCGMSFLEVEWTRRPTLWDLYLEAHENGKAGAEDLWERCEREGLLCGERLKLYPSWFSRDFNAHEKRLKSILKKPELVEKLAPALKYTGGHYVINEKIK
ncbi:radical SAM protein [Thermococcus aggregans]|uniref:Radical SAM protein n=2 Tax=Thermococcus aggregans TaxID=110163 RepID=A0A9E7SPI5_THEAG|nr:radical SAM protein [Thermococcus aggregans]USS41618.1 radical SAM protein [Thermococcus aggregans]